MTTTADHSKSDDGTRAALRWCAAAIAVLVIAFSWPLWKLARFSFVHDAYSHILLVPVISAYLLRLQWRRLPLRAGSGWRVPLLLLVAGAALLVTYFVRVSTRPGLAEVDALAFTTAGFILLLAGTCGIFLGSEALLAMRFPLGFLGCAIPLPTWATDMINGLLQHGSANVAFAMFSAAGTPVLRQGLVFKLPGIVIEIAPECSGIRSTIALFVTSLVAGYLFLRSPWKRVLVAALVAPLAVLRNGFRVFTIGELCVHIGPEMIDSYIHRHGGPIFFVLSLIPFVAALRFLMWREQVRTARTAEPVCAETAAQ